MDEGNPADEQQVTEEKEAANLAAEKRIMKGLMATVGIGRGDWICSNPAHWLYEGAGMKEGETITIKRLVGWEWHGSPVSDLPRMEILASSTLVNKNGKRGKLPLAEDGIHTNAEGQMKLRKITTSAIEEFYQETAR